MSLSGLRCRFNSSLLSSSVICSLVWRPGKLVSLSLSFIVLCSDETFLVVWDLVTTIRNQSRICGKGVGLGFFLFWLAFVRIVWTVCEKLEKWLFFGPFWAKFGCVSHILAIRFWCHCTYRTLIWCRITVDNFVWIVWTVFEKSEKSRKMAVFWPFLG